MEESTRENDNKRSKNKIIHIQKTLTHTFIWILVLPTIFWLLVCIIGLLFPSFKEKLDFDLNEKRYLASFPDDLSSDWFERLEDFYDDHAPFRSILITADTKLSTMLEAPYDKGIRNALEAAIHSGDSNSTAETTEESTIDYASIFGTTEAEAETESAEETAEVVTIETESTPEETAAAETTQTQTVTEATEPVNLPTAPTEAVDTSEYFAPVISNNYTLLGRANWLFLAGDNINYYQANNLPTDEELSNYAEVLGNLQSLCAEKGKKLAILMVPCKPQVYPEYMPTYEVYDSYKRVNRIVDYVSENTDVQICYPLSELKAMKNYYLTYKKYDGHWNAAGSFMGYQMILKMLGMDTTDPLTLVSDMSAVGTGGGDLISPGKLDAANYINDYDYFFHYKDYVNQTGTEGQYFVENQFYRMYSDAECSEQISFIGDSFRNHMILYAFKDFQDSSIIPVSLLGDAGVDQVLTDSDIYVLVFVERDELKMLKAVEYLTALLEE